LNFSMTHYSDSKNAVVQKTFALFLVSLFSLSGCVDISSSGETVVDGRRLVGNIQSNGVTRRLTLDFEGQDICSGTYSGSAAVSVQAVTLSCTNGFEGAATVDATQVRDVATVDFQIPDFQSGRIAIALGAQVSSSQVTNNSGAAVVENGTGQSSSGVEPLMVDGYRGVGDPGPVRSVAGGFPSNYQTAVAAYLRTSLKDPYSFRDGRIARPFYVGRLFPSWIVCVQGRSTNSYGAYTGLKFFQITMRDGEVLPVHTEEGSEAWWCNRYAAGLELTSFDLNAD
jgi:hypothetical protein